jgi:Bacterial CdiA-CT RNAse A domain
LTYARTYDVAEIKGMMMIAEGSANVTAFRVFAAKQAKKKKKALLSAAPAAHAIAKHVGQSATDLATRVDSGPQVASTFKDFDTMVLATVEGLNHANGQTALGTLDAGALDATFSAPLAGNLYFGSRSTRVGAKNSGTANNEPFMVATEITIKVVRFIGGRLWIQTSFPSQLNARQAPSLNDLT